MKSSYLLIRRFWNKKPHWKYEILKNNILSCVKFVTIARNNIISKIKDYKESLTKEQRDEFSKKMSESLKGKTGGFRIGGGRGSRDR